MRTLMLMIDPESTDLFDIMTRAIRAEYALQSVMVVAAVWKGVQYNSMRSGAEDGSRKRWAAGGTLLLLRRRGIDPCLIPPLVSLPYAADPPATGRSWGARRPGRPEQRVRQDRRK